MRSELTNRYYRVYTKGDDSAKRLTLEPTTKQKAERKFKIELIPDAVTKEMQYTGQRIGLRFDAPGGPQ